VKTDLEDDKFVECAIVGKAGGVVSGEHHLLDLHDYAGVRIWSPVEFVASLTSRPK
jgi:predicted nucleic acid-binding protein